MVAALSKEDILDKLRDDLKKYDQASAEEKDKLYEAVELDCVLLVSKKIAPTAEDAAIVGDRMESANFGKDLSDILSKKDNNNNKK